MPDESTLPSTPKNARSLWSRILIIVGSLAMVVGALDPMEGAFVILPGSGLVMVGTFLGSSDRRRIAYRVVVFILIAIGVGAMWGLTQVGGFGGNSGRSMWWGVLILPYLIGWSMGIWGPGSSRWVLWLGVVVGVFYLAVLPLLATHGSGRHRYVGFIVLALLGVLTIGGCICRLRAAHRRG